MNLFDAISPIYCITFGSAKTFKRLNELVAFSKTDKILDLGGGAGRIARHFAGKFNEIVVADPSAGMIKQCKKQKGLECCLAGAENLPFTSEYFDKIYIIDAFHHFQNQVKAVSEIRRVLKPNGVVIVKEFDFGKLNSVLEFFEKLFGIPSRLYSPKDLSQLFNKCNFETRVADEKQLNYFLIAKK